MRESRKRVTAVGLVQAAAVVTIVFSFLTAIDYALHGIELFSPFRLQYLVVSLVLMLLLAALRKPVYTVAMLGTAIFNASLVVPWYLGESPVQPGTGFKVLIANVLADNDEYDRFFDLVATEEPDVIFMQEYSPAWAEQVGRLSADYPYQYTQPRVGTFGIAMFSRLPFDNATHVDSPPFGYPTIVASLAVNGVKLTLISSHPTIPVARALYDARNEQLRSLAELVNAVDGPVVLAGDLNTTIWDHSYRALETSTGLKNARRGFGVLPTWPTFMPFAMIPIDHVLVSEQVQVAEARTAGSIGSDHLPVLVTLVL